MKDMTVTEVKIIDLNHQGEGVGRLNNNDMVVFVPGAIPGEVVKVVIEEKRSKFMRARLLQIISPSPYRQEPSCLLAGSCGGCTFLHMDYHWQLKWKEKLLRTNLLRIGKITEPRVNPVIGMAHPYHYRHKIKLHLTERGDGPGEFLLLGYYQARSHFLSRLPQKPFNCLLAAPVLNTTVQVLEELFNYFLLSPKKKTRRVEGKVIARCSRATGEVMVLVEADIPTIVMKKIAAELSRRISSVVSFYHSYRNRLELVGGKEFIREKLGELWFRISPLSFFQVNPQQTEVLYSLCRSFAALRGNETLIDAYCGTGTISLFLASQAAQVIGIDSSFSAIRDAKANAAQNNITNAQFYCERVENLLASLIAEPATMTILVLDPPREGCRQSVLLAADSPAFSRVVYVSCDSATLARDLGILTARGWNLEVVQPVDMFPHTPHIECVALLMR